MRNNVILITGAAGFIGWNMARHFEGTGHDILACYNHTLPQVRLHAQWEHLPLLQPDLEERICTLAPTAIFHCAAVPGVAACESDRRHAFQVNVAATSAIARAAERLGVPLVYLSTDLVFDGTRGFYDEDDIPNPPTYYGETKLLGEQEALGLCSRSYVLRLALCYGMAQNGLSGFLRWTHNALEEGTTLPLYENQYRSILYANDIPEIIQRLLAHSAEFGIYHLGGPDRLHRLEIGRLFAEKFNRSLRGIVPAWLDRGASLGNIDDTSLITTKARTVTGYAFTEYRNGISQLYSDYSRSMLV